MSQAAVPAYLGKNFNDAPPGHRFSLYLEAWKDDFTLDKTDKTQAIKQALPLPADSANALVALRARQRALAQSRTAEIFDAIATAPFATGLGMEHPLENGFAFLNPYGLPYLPGSGVKGVLRAAARELADGVFGGTEGWTHAAITALFGSDDPLVRGALTFWDVIPTLPCNKMRVDVMTPHQNHYYQEGRTPHDSGQPIPIPFLTVPPKAEFRFIVTCEEKYLRHAGVNLENWKELLAVAFAHAFDWLGFGAKTAVGYGAMTRVAPRDEELERAKTWLNDALDELAKQNRTTTDEALGGRALAAKWQSLSSAAMKTKILGLIRAQWEAKKWWDIPPGKAKKDAKAIYTGAQT